MTANERGSMSEKEETGAVLAKYTLYILFDFTLV